MDKRNRELVMAKLYFKNKDYKMAEKSFNEYLSLNPDDVSALKLMAQVYEQNKRFDKAFEMYERCYLAEPDRTGVLLDISRILLMNEICLDQVDYKKWLNLAIKAFPSNPITVHCKAFLSTLPSQSPQPEITYKSPTEDPVYKILKTLENKIDSIEKKLENMEKKMSNLDLSSDSRLSSSKLSSSSHNTLNNTTLAPIASNTTPSLFQTSFNNLKPTISTPTTSTTTPKLFQTSFNNSNLTSTTPTTSTTSANLFQNSINKFNANAGWGSPSGFSFSEKKINENVVGGTSADKVEENDDDGEGEEVVPNEELPIENFCDMTPVDVRTGEEDENLVFKQRCKLFRFKDGEYKERGLGDIKVLEHKTTGKGRLIMRRDLIGLVCLNCWHCTKIDRFKETQIRFSGIDASDGEPGPYVFLIKFKTEEQTDTFMTHLTRLSSEQSSSADTSTGANCCLTPPQKSVTSKTSNIDKLQSQSKLDQSLFGSATKSPSFFDHKPQTTTTSFTTSNLFSNSINKLNISTEPTTTSTSTSHVFPSSLNMFNKTTSASTNSATAPGLFQSSFNNLDRVSNTPTTSTTAPSLFQSTFNSLSFTSNLPTTSTTTASLFQTSFNNLNLSSTTPTTSTTTGNLFQNSINKFNANTGWGSQTGFSFSLSTNQKNDNVIGGTSTGRVEENDDDGEGEEVVPNEELPIENFCDMTPVEVKTGEEDENLVFKQRCKLFRFKDGEYKERGLGDIKVLEHKTTGKGRLIMRRDLIGLVCLNCWNCTKIDRLKETQIRFSGIDASDGEPGPYVFLIKFKTEEQTDTFITHLNRLFAEESSSTNTSLVQSSTTQALNSESSTENAEIELIDPKLDQSLVDKARKLQLPDLFYHKLKNQEPCKGCDGCTDDK